jgi:dienelactone hydrolase
VFQVIGFMKEMTDRRADWQLHAYGNACHGFTEPDADKLGFPGVGYNRLADERSWRALSDLLVEKFGNVTADKH